VPSITWRFWAFLFSTVIVLAIVSAIVVVRNQRKENREWCREQGYLIMRPMTGTA
jgi:hypothetical protein